MSRSGFSETYCSYESKRFAIFGGNNEKEAIEIRDNADQCSESKCNSMICFEPDEEGLDPKSK